MSAVQKRNMKLNHPTISKIINDLWPDFLCTENDLKHPTFEFLMKFTIYLAKNFELNGVDQMIKVEQRNNPESFSDTAKMINIYKILKFMLKKIAYEGFEYMDLLTPSVKTVMPMLKVVCNFLLFLNCTYNQIAPQLDEIQEERKKYEQLLQEKLNFEQIIDDFNKSEMNHNQQLEKFKELSESKEEEYKLATYNLNTLKETKKTVEMNNEKMQKKCIELKKKLNQLENEENKLTNQLVENSSFLQEKYDNLLKVKNELKEKQIRQKKVLEVEQNKISVLESIHTELNELRSENTLFSAKAKYINTIKLLEKKEKDEATLDLKITNIEEKISQTKIISEDYITKQHVVNEKIKKLTNELDDSNKEFKSFESRQLKLKTDYKNILEKIQLMEAACSQYAKNDKQASMFYEKTLKKIFEKEAEIQQQFNDKIGKQISEDKSREDI